MELELAPAGPLPCPLVGAAVLSRRGRGGRNTDNIKHGHEVPMHNLSVVQLVVWVRFGPLEHKHPLSQSDAPDVLLVDIKGDRNLLLGGQVENLVDLSVILALRVWLLFLSLFMGVVGSRSMPATRLGGRVHQDAVFLAVRPDRVGVVEVCRLLVEAKEAVPCGYAAEREAARRGDVRELSFSTMRGRPWRR